MRELGCSWDLFHKAIEPELKVIRLGRRKMIPIAELEHWLETQAERVL